MMTFNYVYAIRSKNKKEYLGWLAESWGRVFDISEAKFFTSEESAKRFVDKIILVTNPISDLVNVVPVTITYNDHTYERK